MTAGDADALARAFESHRAHLRQVALRMLGSSDGADDAVQEAWLRLSGSDAGSVENLGGWLTTVVARVCLDVLRSRGRARVIAQESALETVTTTTPEEEVVLADSVGLALLVVLETLAPAERITFVLHDLFAVPFDEIAPIVGRSPVAARQLASRARRRIQADPSLPDSGVAKRRMVVAAFLAASRGGDFAGLLRLLDPDIVLRADPVAVAMATSRASAGAPELREEIRGPDEVLRVFAGGAKAARATTVDGSPGAMVAVGGRPMVVFDFVVRGDRVAAIEVIADPQTLGALDLEPTR